MRDALRIWTVYDHPTDFPEHYVARLFLVTGKGSEATTITAINRDLKLLREQLERLGLTRLPRDPNDEPQIVESWV